MVGYNAADVNAVRGSYDTHNELDACGRQRHLAHRWPPARQTKQLRQRADFAILKQTTNRIVYCIGVLLNCWSTTVFDGTSLRHAVGGAGAGLTGWDGAEEPAASVADAELGLHLPAHADLIRAGDVGRGAAARPIGCCPHASDISTDNNTQRGQTGTVATWCRQGFTDAAETPERGSGGYRRRLGGERSSGGGGGGGPGGRR